MAPASAVVSGLPLPCARLCGISMVGSIPAVRIAAISSRSAISNLRNCIPGSQPSIAERGLAPLINHLILRDYEPDLSDEPPRSRGCLETSPPLSAGHYSAAV